MLYWHKVCFIRALVLFLGYIISMAGAQMDEGNISVVLQGPTLKMIPFTGFAKGSWGFETFIICANSAPHLKEKLPHWVRHSTSEAYIF